MIKISSIALDHTDGGSVIYLNKTIKKKREGYVQGSIHT